MSTTNEETEIVLFAKIDDPNVLNEAENIEDHIQLEVRTETGAKMRVRKITPVKGDREGGASRYEFTMKQNVQNKAGVKSALETTQEVDRNFYENFAGIAEQAIVKRRYSFTGNAPKTDLHVPAVVYEVDEFVNISTKEKSQWYKIEIEIDHVIDALKKQGIETDTVKQKFDFSNLPFTSLDMFSPSNMSDEQKQLLDRLWEEEFAKKLSGDASIIQQSVQPQGEIPKESDPVTFQERSGVEE